jgi:2-amino-4-hydroxy-6-hydroxymethyldihydropteridine diphosphokinase
MFRYAIALGSNRRHGRHGTPASVVTAAIEPLRSTGIAIVAISPILATAPIGPSIRTFANAAALIETPLDPPALLALLKQIERAFGRRRGQRWGARVLDLDILLWSGGRWRSRQPALSIPHAALGQRRFVLDPLVKIAPAWRVPGAATVRQLQARLTRPRPTHRSGAWSGP